MKYILMLLFFIGVASANTKTVPLTMEYKRIGIGYKHSYNHTRFNRPYGSWDPKPELQYYFESVYLRIGLFNRAAFLVEGLLYPLTKEEWDGTRDYRVTVLGAGVDARLWRRGKVQLGFRANYQYLSLFDVFDGDQSSIWGRDNGFKVFHELDFKMPVKYIHSIFGQSVEVGIGPVLQYTRHHDVRYGYYNVWTRSDDLIGVVLELDARLLGYLDVSVDMAQFTYLGINVSCGVSF